MTKRSILSIARGIAIHLPGRWSLIDFESEGAHPGFVPSVCRLENKEGHRIHLRLKEGRVYISGNYPRYDNKQLHVKNDPRISVAATKKAAVIARDIMRRFLPDYITAYQSVVGRITDYDKGNREGYHVFSEMAEITNGRQTISQVWNRGQTLVKHHRLDFRRNGAMFDLEWWGLNDIKLSGHTIPSDLALRIIECIAEYYEEKSNE